MLDRRDKILGRVVEKDRPLRDLEGQHELRSFGEVNGFLFRSFGRAAFRQEDKGLVIFCMSPFVKAIWFRVFL